MDPRSRDRKPAGFGEHLGNDAKEQDRVICKICQREETEVISTGKSAELL